MIRLIGMVLIVLPVVGGIITVNILPYYFVCVFFKLKDYISLSFALSLGLVIDGITLLFIANVIEGFVYKRGK